MALEAANLQTKIQEQFTKSVLNCKSIVMYMLKITRSHQPINPTLSYNPHIKSI